MFWVEIDLFVYFFFVVFLYVDEIRMDGEFLKLILYLLCFIVCCVIGLIVVLVVIGKLFGIRKLYISVLFSIFEVKFFIYLFFVFIYVVELVL